MNDGCYRFERTERGGIRVFNADTGENLVDYFVPPQVAIELFAFMLKEQEER